MAAQTEVTPLGENPSYYRARYYDGASGRFISEDPISFEIGPNFYAYVGNNPMGHVDPSGLCPCGYHRVILYYTPDFGGRGYPDYHWYRQDSNGGWSSKHGLLPVGPQVDPGKDAAAGIPGFPGTSYPDFCAFMCAPNHNGACQRF